jgi:hypothetical protein
LASFYKIRLKKGKTKLLNAEAAVEDGVVVAVAGRLVLRALPLPLQP